MNVSGERFQEFSTKVVGRVEEYRQALCVKVRHDNDANGGGKAKINIQCLCKELLVNIKGKLLVNIIGIKYYW